MLKTLVVQCSDEAARFDAAAFVVLSGRRPGLRLVFVDDGSTDDTAAMLSRVWTGCRENVEVLRRDTSSGNAGAVQRGAGLQVLLTAGRALVARSVGVSAVSAPRVDERETPPEEA